MQETIDYLKDHGSEIGEKAKAGDTKAAEIISLYKMHYSQPSDPGAAGLLIAAVADYRTQI